MPPANTITRPTRQDTYAVSVSLDGVDLGIFDKFDGGGIDSEETKYKPGALAREISLGGSVTSENVTVSRIYDLERDHRNVKTWLSRVGKGAVVVKKQPLDIDGNTFGDPITYTGVLKRVTPPTVDSESSDAGMIEFEVSIAGEVG